MVCQRAEMNLNTAGFITLVSQLWIFLFLLIAFQYLFEVDAFCMNIYIYKTF